MKQFPTVNLGRFAGYFQSTWQVPLLKLGLVARSNHRMPFCPSRLRARGKPSRKEKAANQQYLTPPEEQALIEYVLRMANNGYPLPVKFLRSLAWIIARQRSSNVL